MDIQQAQSQQNQQLSPEQQVEIMQEILRTTNGQRDSLSNAVAGLQAQVNLLQRTCNQLVQQVEGKNKEVEELKKKVEELTPSKDAEALKPTE